MKQIDDIQVKVAEVKGTQGSKGIPEATLTLKAHLDEDRLKALGFPWPNIEGADKDSVAQVVMRGDGSHGSGSGIMTFADGGGLVLAEVPANVNKMQAKRQWLDMDILIELTIKASFAFGRIADVAQVMAEKGTVSLTLAWAQMDLFTGNDEARSSGSGKMAAFRIVPGPRVVGQ